VSRSPGSGKIIETVKVPYRARESRRPDPSRDGDTFTDALNSARSVLVVPWRHEDLKSGGRVCSRPFADQVGELPVAERVMATVGKGEVCVSVAYDDVAGGGDCLP